MSNESRLRELGLELPPAPQALGAYQSIVQVERLAYLSGHLPIRSDGSLWTGRVGEDLDVEAAQHAARDCGLAMLATLRDALGTLDRVRRVIKILGLVSAPANFGDHPQVINGCSELFRDVFGPERGVGARSACGVSSLPKGVPVEIEAIVEIATDGQE